MGSFSDIILFSAFTTVLIASVFSTNAMQIQVVDADDGRPLSTAKLIFRADPGESRILGLDATGTVQVPFPPGERVVVVVIATGSGHVPMMADWVASEAPAEFIFMLPSADRIGGVVEDQDGSPVAGAAVRLIVPRRLGGVRTAVEELPCRTDAMGRWRCDFAPKDVARFRIEVSHPDFEPLTMESAAAGLRQRTAAMRLTAKLNRSETVLGAAAPPRGVEPPVIELAAPSLSERVSAAATVQPSLLHPGERGTVFIRIRVAAGCHVYPLEDPATRYTATTIRWEAPDALMQEGPWLGPEPRVELDGSRTLSGDLWFQGPFRVSAAASQQSIVLRLQLSFQVCNEAVCWPPETKTLETRMDIVRSSR